jgi:hypothetical protein
VTSDAIPEFAQNGLKEYSLRMASLIPILLIAAVLLAAPQAVIAAVIVALAVGISVVISKLIFTVIGDPASR